MLYIEKSGIIRFLLLLGKYGGISEPELGGVIIVERNNRDNCIAAQLLSDFGNKYDAPAVPDFPRMKVWVCPDLDLYERDIYLRLTQVSKPKGEWFRADVTNAVDLEGFVPALTI